MERRRADPTRPCKRLADGRGVSDRLPGRRAPIGSASIATLAKDLRRRLSGLDPRHQDWKLDANSYTVAEVANRAREFFFNEAFQEAYGEKPPADFFLGFKVCGYSAGAPLSELYDIRIINDVCAEPALVIYCPRLYLVNLTTYCTSVWRRMAPRLHLSLLVRRREADRTHREVYFEVGLAQSRF
jgi:hypothetical protein